MEEAAVKALAELIEAIKATAPHVWAAYYKQVLVRAFEYAAWGLGLLVIMRLTFYVRRWERNRNEDNDWGYEDHMIVTSLSWVGTVVASLIAFACFVGAAMLMLNPSYYAMRMLIQHL